MYSICCRCVYVYEGICICVYLYTYMPATWTWTRCVCGVSVCVCVCVCVFAIMEGTTIAPWRQLKLSQMFKFSQRDWSRLVKRQRPAPLEQLLQNVFCADIWEYLVHAQVIEVEKVVEVVQYVDKEVAFVSYLSLYLSISIYICRSISIYNYLYLWIYNYLYVSIELSIYLWLPRSVYLYICLSIYYIHVLRSRRKSNLTI